MVLAALATVVMTVVAIVEDKFRLISVHTIRECTLMDFLRAALCADINWKLDQAGQEKDFLKQHCYIHSCD